MAGGGAHPLVTRPYVIATMGLKGTLALPRNTSRTASPEDNAISTVRPRMTAISLLVRYQDRSSLARKRREVYG